ncbi:hypothetical protein [Paenibacillus sp. LjRoot56]|uniref:hypothetical protein n=1 Tax=Paenibacillus sp. LjRoot56 TaxID=3342333 RepID=UPI003ED0150B
MEIIEKESLIYQKKLGYLDFMNGMVSLFVLPNIHKSTINGIDKVKLPENKVKILQHELKDKNFYPQETISYLSNMTTYFHELKHWHEYVGTTLGYEIFKINLEYYSRALMILRHMGNNLKNIKLPLGNHSFYRKATSKHTMEYREFLTRYQSIIKNRVFVVDNIFEDVSKLKAKNLKCKLLKDIPFFKGITKLEDVAFFDVPITGITLLEASAVLTQVFAIHDVYGLEEAELFLKWGFENTKFWAYNSVIKSMVCANSNVPVEMMQAIISNSIIYPLTTKNKQEKDPIERFITFLGELRETKEMPSSLDEIREWLLNIYVKYSWIKPKDFINMQIEESRKIVSLHQEEQKRTDNLTDAIEDYLASYHKDRLFFLQKTYDDIMFWSHDYYFTENPSPHLMNISTKHNESMKFKSNNENSSLRWFLSTEIVNQLITKEKEEFECPFKGKGKCTEETTNCGKLPLTMPPEHPECEFLVTACEVVLPNWDLV